MPSATQKSLLKRRLRSAASASRLVGVLRVVPEQPSQPRAAHLRVVGVALQFAGRPREPGQPAVRVADRVPGVLPALVLQAGLLVASLVRDVAVAHQVGVVVDPGERRAGLGSSSRTRSCRRSTARTRRAGPRTAASRRRCRSRASAGAPRTRSARRSATRAGSGRDPHRGSRRPGCPASRPAPAAWSRRDRRERQRLQAGEDAVPAEHRHEPGQSGGGQAVRRPAMAGGNRSAARSTRLRWYVVCSGSQSQSSRGAPAIHLSSSASMSRRTSTSRACRGISSGRSARAWPASTCRSVSTRRADRCVRRT